MNASPRAIAIILAMLTLSSCGTWTTDEDEKRLAALEREFGHRYEFSPQSDLYLDARCRADEPPTREEAERIFRAFWFTDRNEPRTDSAYVYLNIFDNRGVFQFQVFWDHRTKHLAYSGRPYY